MTARKVCAIVDPYSSSNLYGPALRAHGYDCIAVLSQATPTDMIAGSFKADDFVEVLRFTGNFEHLLSDLNTRNVQLIIPGMEMGLELADALGERLNTKIFNSPKTSARRRHKYEMVEAVKRHGLQAAAQTKSSDVYEVVAWAKKVSSWPVVIKPADSGGADRVFLCDDETQLIDAIQFCLGSLGRQGRLIKEIVAQEFLRGTEYIVDTVSYHGRHMVTDIWKYNRIAINGAPFVYDTKELISCDDEVAVQLIDYTKAALDAVELENGPAHTEIIITSSGPKLVEINARFGGSMAPILNRECLGRGQLEAMMDVILAPEHFLSYCDAPYQIHKHGLAVYLISQSDDYIINQAMLDEIKGLPSCHSLRVGPSGSRLQKTVDMFTMPGMVELVHESREQIQHDYNQIRAIEASECFYIRS